MTDKKFCEGGMSDIDPQFTIIERLAKIDASQGQMIQTLSRLMQLVEGDGRTGLLGRVGGLEKQIDDAFRLETKLENAVFGNGKPGLKDRVDEIESWMERMNRLLAAVFVPLSIAILLGAIGFLWALLNHTVEIVSH